MQRRCDPRPGRSGRSTCVSEMPIVTPAGKRTDTSRTLSMMPAQGRGGRGRGCCCSCGGREGPAQAPPRSGSAPRNVRKSGFARMRGICETFTRKSCSCHRRRSMNSFEKWSCGERWGQRETRRVRTMRARRHLCRAAPPTASRTVRAWGGRRRGGATPCTLRAAPRSRRKSLGSGGGRSLRAGPTRAQCGWRTMPPVRRPHRSRPRPSQ